MTEPTPGAPAADPFGPEGEGLWQGDCRALLPRLPDDSVHLILSDIPYGIGVDTWDVLHDNRNAALLGQSPAQARAGAVFRRRGKPINGWSEADAAIPREYGAWCATWASHWLRVLRPGGSALVFAGRRFVHRCAVALEDAGFLVRDQLAWLRPRAVHRAQRLSVVFDRRGDHARARAWEGWRLGNLRPTFEPILWCFKPYQHTIADNVAQHQVGAFHQAAFERLAGAADNALRFGLDPGEGGLHPTQKPLRLLRALIELTTLPGQRILDPFAGSGSTAVAARQCGRRYLAIEQDPVYCEVTRRRLADAKR